MARRALFALCALLALPLSKSTPDPEARRAAVAAYARAWATPGDARRGNAKKSEWMAGFGAIDVGCSLEVERAGADPRANKRYTSTRVEERDRNPSNGQL